MKRAGEAGNGKRLEAGRLANGRGWKIIRRGWKIIRIQERFAQSRG